MKKQPNIKLNHRQKCAILIMALDARSPGLSQQLFSKMGETQSKLLLHEISQLGKINTHDIDLIIEEFYSLAITQENLLGGKNLTNKLLKDSFGIEDSNDYFATKKGLFEFTKNIDEKTLLEYLKKENSQATALMLSLFSDDKSAELLARFPVDQTAQISNKMLSLNIPNYKLLWKFHKELEIHILGDNTAAISDSQQIFKLSRVLEMMVSERREVVMNMIKTQNQESAEKLEKLIFAFPDLIHMTGKDLGNVLMEIEPLKTLAIAMTNISTDLETKLYDSVSERLKGRLEESILQVKDSSEEDIQNAQTEIIQLCRKLEQDEKIDSLSKIIELKEDLG